MSTEASLRVALQEAISIIGGGRNPESARNRKAEEWRALLKGDGGGGPVAVALPEDMWLTILSWYGPVEGEGYDGINNQEAGQALEAALIAQGVPQPDGLGWRWHS